MKRNTDRVAPGDGPFGRGAKDESSVALRHRYEAEGRGTERYSSAHLWDARYHRRRFHHVSQLLSVQIRPGDSFLDVGCGTGEYLAAARGLGAARSVGVDLARSYLERLRADGSEPLLAQADALALPWADRSFDVVLCSEVIEHLPPEQSSLLLDEALRVCRRAAIVTTPNREAAIRRLARLLAAGRVKALDHEVGHINLLSHAQLLAMSERAGFRLAQMESRHILPPVIGDSMHLPRRLDRVVTHCEQFADRRASSVGNTLYAVLLVQ
jgi:2-polyprenyl-3-methyl-5-hydroxy-6-metoxy-1,4-benzoquinol methylase